MPARRSASDTSRHGSDRRCRTSRTVTTTNRDDGNYNEESVVALERSKRGAGIGDVNQIEEVRHYNASIVRANGSQYPVLRQLVQSVERKREKEDEPHCQCRQAAESTNARMPNAELMTKHECTNGTPSRDFDHSSVKHSFVIRSFGFRHCDCTTLSHRSHKSGCALLVPTVGRCRQQRAHFL